MAVELKAVKASLKEANAKLAALEVKGKEAQGQAKPPSPIP